MTSDSDIVLVSLYMHIVRALDVIIYAHVVKSKCIHTLTLTHIYIYIQSRYIHTHSHTIEFIHTTEIIHSRYERVAKSF